MAAAFRRNEIEIGVKIAFMHIRRFVLACSLVCAAAEAAHLSNAVFAYELGEQTAAQQARLVQEAGFDGTVFDDATLVPDRLRAVDEQRVQLFFLWITADVSDGRIKYEPGMETAIGQLKGRNTVVWLAVPGKGPGAEQRAVEACRHVADLAAASNLRVALYPHHGFYLAHFRDVVRVADEAQRSNVGVTFNLCHELHAGFDADWKAQIRNALPRLYAVTISGADTNGRDWDTLIQPLGKGDFDVPGLVRTVVEAGYRGPIGVQCYGIKGNPREYLAQSMKEWSRMRGED